MKLTAFLPLVALANAIVIPEGQVLNELALENQHDDKSLFETLKDTADEAVKASKDFFEQAIERVFDARDSTYEQISARGFDMESWLNHPIDTPFSVLEEEGDHPHPPHHGPPPHKKPGHKKPGHRKPPHHGPPGHHHPPHHGHKHNQTIYELISNSSYTTKLAKLVSEDDELVKLLNGTSANFTLFAFTDRALEKLERHAPHGVSKEFLKRLLPYHISPHFYPAGRVLFTHTIPTLFNSSDLGPNHPQRLSVNVGLRGLTLNHYVKVIATDIFATNGVIHGIDFPVIPPPKIIDIIGFFPSEFSTLTLGLTKTGLLDTLNTTAHTGATFFAPSNFAFKKLGPKVNAFLFSKYGEKYLKALLQYHVVLNSTLYSDAFYDFTDKALEAWTFDKVPEHDDAQKPLDQPPRPDHHPHRGYYHFDLPTLLDDRSLAVDVARFGPFISIKVNGFSRVVVQDGVARDGVIQVVGDVLIPPRRLAADADDDEEPFWTGEELSVDEFKERLEPYVEGGRGEQMDL